MFTRVPLCRLLLQGLMLACCLWPPAGWAQESDEASIAPLPPSVDDSSVHNNAVTYSRQGMALMAVERYEEAAEHFKAAIRLNPYAAMAASLYNNLGIAYQQMQQYPLAIASFQHAMRIQPNYELYYKNLVQTYRLSGDLATALETLQTITQANPANAEAHYLLGLAFEEADQPEAARGCFKTYLALKPHAALAHAAKQHLKQPTQ